MAIVSHSRELGDLVTAQPELARTMHRQMVRIRLFEERVGELVEAKEVRTPAHLYIGQEAVAAGVCAALDERDYVVGNHRSHGHYLAKGGSMAALMAEILCKTTGCSRGRGGSMHLIAPEVGFLGTVPMVAATIPIAVGAALSARMRREDRVAVAFFGDGSTEEGVFHEAVNFAALKELPVLFVCENNLYSSHLRLAERRPPAATQLERLAASYGIAARQVDGNDVLAVYAAADEAVDRARGGGGPTFLECLTYRWRGHVGPRDDLDVGIRDPRELASWMARCPIKLLEAHLLATGVADADALAAVHAEASLEVEQCVDFARRSPAPAASRVSEAVFVASEVAP